MNILTQKYIERFWGKVDKERSNTFYNGTRCWEWKAAHLEKGYGYVRYGYEMALSHRISYEITFGKIQKKLWVLHHCDNPKCVNPGHLFLGNCQDNADDKVRKGRSGIGEKNSMCKLTDKEVCEIRNRYSTQNESQRFLAEFYGVSQKQISNIVLQKSRT